MLKKLTTFALVIAALSSIASSAIVGTNEYLDTHNGRAFIPQQEATSGTLGESKGNRIIGASSDLLILAQGQQSFGFLNYTLEFDLSNEPSIAGQNLTHADLETGAAIIMFLSLTDIDFNPVVANGTTYFETLELTFRADSYTGTDVASVLINATNYTEFRQDEGTATNNTQAVYQFNLLDDALTDEQIDAMFSDEKFYLDVQLTSTTERFGAGIAGYRNTLEYLGDYSTDGGFGDDGLTGASTLEISLVPPAPEPMTASLLAIGAIALIRRRRI